MNQISPHPQEQLPALIDRASSALAAARSSAEVLEARDTARLAYDVAKSAGRIARAKGAHDAVIAAVYRAQADALLIESRAKVRLADEYDAAQDRGEIAKLGSNQTEVGVSDGNTLPTAADLNLSRKDIHEARQIRNAEATDKGAVERALEGMVSAGEEPTRAKLKRRVIPETDASTRRGLSAFTREGLEGEVVELREALTEAEGKAKALKADNERLKHELRDLTGDQADAIRRLRKEVANANNSKWRAEEKANALLRHNHILKKRVKELENMPISMD